MTFEERLESIDTTLKLLATLMQSGQALSPANVSAAAETAVPTAEKKPRTKKADAAIEAVEEKKEQSTAVAEPTTAAVETPVVSTLGASTASAATSEVSWKNVLDKLLELNKSTAPGHGREGVLSVIAKFPFPDGKTAGTVPELEKLGNHAGILAFVESLLAPAAVEEKPLF